jgi:hypothetical protein
MKDSLNHNTPFPHRLTEYAKGDRACDSYGILTHIRHFPDGSRIMYYDNGEIRFAWEPCSVLETPPSPQAHLYYWHVERNRPDIVTWEDIRNAEK